MEVVRGCMRNACGVKEKKKGLRMVEGRYKGVDPKEENMWTSCTDQVRKYRGGMRRSLIGRRVCQKRNKYNRL